MPSRFAPQTSWRIRSPTVKADPAVGEPLLDPAVRLLAQRIGVWGSGELGGHEGLVPLALAEAADVGLAHEHAHLVDRQPSFDEGVAHVEEHSTKSHAGIVSTRTCWTSSSSPSSRSGDSAPRAASSARSMARAETSS